MSRKKKAIFASASVLVNFIVIALVQFTLAPLVIKFADSETLGEFSILLQILGYVAIVDFGFTAAFQRYLARSHGIEAATDSDRILRDSRLWFAGVDLVRAASGWILIELFEITATGSTSFDYLQHVYWIVAIWYALRGWLTIYSPALIALQNISTSIHMTTLSVLVRLFVSTGLLVIGFGLEAMIWGIVISEIALNLGCYWFFTRRFGRIEIAPRTFSWSHHKPIVYFGFKSIPIGFASVSRQQSDGLIAGLTLGAGAASILYTTKMPALLVVSLIYSIVITVTPVLYQMHSTEDEGGLSEIYNSLHRYNFMLCMTAAFGLLLFHAPFVAMWVGTDQYGGFDMTVAYAFYIVIIACSNVNTQFALSEGGISLLSVLSAVEGGVTLISAYILSQHYGLFGTALAMALANLITFFYLWRITLRTYSMSRRHFLAFAFFPPFFVAGGAAAAIYVLYIFWPTVSLFVAIALFLSLVAVGGYFFVLLKSDAAALHGMGRKLLFRNSS